MRAQGDKALKDLTSQFDGVSLEQILYQVVPEGLSGKYGEDLRSVLEEAADNIRRFHQRQKQQSQMEFESDGTLLG